MGKNSIIDEVRTHNSRAILEVEDGWVPYWIKCAPTGRRMSINCTTPEKAWDNALKNIKAGLYTS